MVYQNYQLRSKFLAGLQIVGQDFFKELEWIGSTEQWKESERIENNMIFEPKGYPDSFTSSKEQEIL